MDFPPRHPDLPAPRHPDEIVADANRESAAFAAAIRADQERAPVDAEIGALRVKLALAEASVDKAEARQRDAVADHDRWVATVEARFTAVDDACAALIARQETMVEIGDKMAAKLGVVYWWRCWSAAKAGVQPLDARGRQVKLPPEVVAEAMAGYREHLT